MMFVWIAIAVVMVAMVVYERAVNTEKVDKSEYPDSWDI